MVDYTASGNKFCTHFVFNTMKLFEYNWLSSKWVDFEYKKFTLLAYLQHVDSKYSQSKVYPYLQLLKSQLDDLLLIRRNFENFDPNAVQKMLYGDDYRRCADSDEMEIIRSVVDFALPRLENSIGNGLEIEDLVRNSVRFEPVGVIPVERREGYLIFNTAKLNRIYRYELRRIEPGADDEIHSAQLKTWFIESQSCSPFGAYTDIKYNMIKRDPSLPNPATYVVASSLSVPYTETLVPIGRKLLYDRIIAR